MATSGDPTLCITSPNLSIFWSSSSHFHLLLFQHVSPHSTIPPANSMRHRPLTLSMSVCPFLSSLPLLFRGLFISVERWMRDWGHLQELIKPPAHTHANTHTDIHTDAETRRNSYRDVDASLNLRVHTHTDTPLNTKEGEKANNIWQDDTYKLTTARQQLCRTRALKSLAHILHVKRERNKISPEKSKTWK